MGTFEKTYKRINAYPVKNDITFEEIAAFLTNPRVNFKMTDNGGSHCKFRNQSVLLTIPRKALKPYLILQIREALEKLEIEI